MADSDYWYKDAIIYAVDVAKFADGNGDGIGDFKGLTGRLGYLSRLGVTCIWLLPFYVSPDRDNRYDVADFYNIDPQLGTFPDFLEFLHKAGEHGIRVILDLVLSHTSDAHPWFEAARRDENSRYRDYYVWSPNPPAVLPSEHSILPGQNAPVWTYDEVARSFYYHRFFPFEPALNTFRSEVREEMLRIMDLWLSYGISGFRVDGAPLLIQPKPDMDSVPGDPHDLLRRLHGFARSRPAGAFLLAEANVAPERLKTFFGGGDQIGLLFNFILDDYLFLALARGQAEPIVKGLNLLPQPPEPCGWANFLRNLDEFDLERLKKDEQEAVYAAFAPDPDMRIFGRGIRRRLAPMLGGDPRRIALAFSLLFSLPGAPLFVYGDEIGMGEDLSQPGRAAVRAPMQWSDEKNAGFSRAEPGDLVQPVIAKGAFSYRKVNVAAQMDDMDSLLTRVRWLVQQRRLHPGLSTGRFKPLDGSDPAVLAHSYDLGPETLVMLHNLADRPGSVPVDLGKPALLRDLGTGERFDTGAEAGAIPLAPYGYRWFEAIES